MIFHWIVLDLYSYNLHKNAEKPGVISFLSQIFCQKAVRGSRVSGINFFRFTNTDYYHFTAYSAKMQYKETRALHVQRRRFMPPSKPIIAQNYEYANRKKNICRFFFKGLLKFGDLNPRTRQIDKNNMPTCILQAFLKKSDAQFGHYKSLVDDILNRIFFAISVFIVIAVAEYFVQTISPFSLIGLFNILEIRVFLPSLDCPTNLLGT